MKRLLLLLLLVSQTGALLAQTKYAIGTWIDYLPYKNALLVAQSADKVYCATNVSLYSVDKTYYSTEKISKCNGLSDIGYNYLAFDDLRNQLIIAYQNSNIDIYNNGNVINLPDIKNKNLPGDKNIYNIYVKGNYAYLSCGFGIELLNLDSLYFSDTYYIGTGGNSLKVNAVTSDSNFLYAATDSGLFVASLDNPFLSDYASWDKLGTASGLPVTKCQHVISANNTVYASFDSTIYVGNDATWSKLFTVQGGFQVNSIYIAASKLYSCLIAPSGASELNIYNLTSNTDTAITHQNYLGYPEQLVIDKQGGLWLADLYNGLTHGNIKNQYFYYPDGPATNDVWQLDAYNGDIYVAPGGVTNAVNFGYNRDGFFIYHNNSWENFTPYTNSVLDGANDSLLDILSVAHDPFTGKTYFTSWDNGGVIEVDGNNIDTVYKYGYLSYGSFGSYYPAYSNAIDSNGNLWVTNPSVIASDPIVVKTPDGKWYHFPAKGISQTNYLYKIYPDRFNQVWISIYNFGLLVYNYGLDITSTSDDAYTTLTTGVGQGNLPDPNVNCMVLDNLDEMWLGTNQGIAVIYCPYSITQPGGCDAQQIIVEGADSIAGYLLGSEIVTAIDIDAGDRKWVGTEDGLWLFSEDGSQQIFHFTTDNSPLFSNTITAIKVDKQSGIVYVGTDKGLLAYQGDATTPSTQAQCNMLVYPNPVENDYSGPIAFRGLPYNATVKVSDVEGRLVYQTTSNGGTATWNGLNYQGQRAHTGIYYVTASAIDANANESKCISTLIFVK